MRMAFIRKAYPATPARTAPPRARAAARVGCDEGFGLPGGADRARDDHREEAVEAEGGGGERDRRGAAREIPAGEADHADDGEDRERREAVGAGADDDRDAGQAEQDRGPAPPADALAEDQRGAGDHDDRGGLEDHGGGGERRQGDGEDVEEAAGHLETGADAHGCREDVGAEERVSVRERDGGEEDGSAEAEEAEHLSDRERGGGGLEEDVLDREPGHRGDHPERAREVRGGRGVAGGDHAFARLGPWPERSITVSGSRRSSSDSSVPRPGPVMG